jgi:hypothetical protein
MGSRYRAAVSGATAVALALGCGSSPASAPAMAHAVSRSSAVAPKRPRWAIDRLGVVARQRYLEEVQGAAVHRHLRRVAADPVLLRTLRTLDLAALRAEVLHVDVVVRGRGPAHVRTSLPGAARLTLPSSGTVTIGRHRYRVRSFRERGLAGETLRIWILERG